MWLERFRRFWSRHLDALATELARGERERGQRRDSGATTAGTPDRRQQSESASEEDT